MKKENMNLNKIFSLVIKDGLREYKFKNSHLKPLDYQEEGNKGSIFAYRSKENMISAKGVVITSVEALKENDTQFTHWTPNVYRYGTYSDARRLYTRGHAEKNLRQINCFYVDFDNPKEGENINSGDILTASIDLGFMPTMILRTDKGYQAYFILETAVYVSSHTQFKAISTAKLISDNLRKYFKAQSLPVDMACNHFGIARIPRSDNIEFFEESYCYSFKEWISWSSRQGNYPNKKANLSIISGTEGKKQIDEPWYKLLMNESNIKGSKALMGRNSILFTLALANYSSGVSQIGCEEALSDFNNHLDEPLSVQEFQKIIQSAYSEKYEAASREYIKLLCKAWVDKNLTSNDLFIRQGWSKFKKPRSVRQNSHLHEWKADIMVYLEGFGQDADPFLQTTKKALREQLSIPERSLDRVLKALKAEQKIFLTVKSGRRGGIRLASVKAIFISIIQVRKKRQEQYFSNIANFFEESKVNICKVIERVKNEFKQKKQLSLFESDVG